MRKLQAHDYSPEQIEGALGTVFGVDRQLIEDGTYFLVEAVGEAGVASAGCGGWSRRKTLFGSDRHASSRESSLLDPMRENARIRAFFVHPDWARRGVGTLILDACERAAAGEGFQGFEMGATLTGQRLFAARGYAAMERIEIALENGVLLPVVRMSKSARL